MKQTIKTSRTAGYLEKMFRALNERYFAGNLEEPIITIQSTPRAYGHVTVSKSWRKGQEQRHELNIGAGTLDRPIENVTATLLHEMVHLLNIKDAGMLERAEADITSIKLLVIDGVMQSQAFDFSRLLAIHKHIFEDIFEWAGTIRTISIVKRERVLGGDTIRYSQPNDIERDCATILKKLNELDWSTFGVNETAETFSKLIAALWQTHPFREGNTRTVVTFATQFAEAHGFRMDKTLLKDSAAYVRDALVKASDGQYAEYEYLIKIFEDAIRRG